MAIANVYELALPGAVSTIFTDGEKALSPGVAVNAVSNGTYYLYKRITLPAGVYKLKAMLAPGGSISLAGVTLSSTGMLYTQVDIPSGEIVINITLNQTGGDCYAALLISQIGSIAYKSSGDGWVFDTSPLTTEFIPSAADPRMLLPVFGVLPNWSNGIIERVNYLTDVMSSETAVEQRRAIREFPRRSIEASFMRSDVLRARMDQFFVGVGRSEFMLPLWHEQFRTTLPIIAGETYHQFPVVGDTLDFREFLAGDLVLITSGDPLTQEVCKIASVDAITGHLVWQVAPTLNWPAGARLMPLRRAVMVDKPNMSNMVDRIGSVSVRFDLQDPMTNIVPNWGLCTPMWHFDLDWSSPLVMDYDRATFMLDNSSGPVTYTDAGRRSEVTTRVNLTMYGRRDLYSLRQFIAAARGKAVRFYAPTFTHDLIPANDMTGAYLDVKSVGFSEVMTTPQWARKVIEIKFNNGAPPIYRFITLVSEATLSGERVDRIYVDAALPSIAKSTVSTIRFIVPSRFDQDGFEFNHLVDASAVVRLAIVLQSATGDGMQSLACLMV